MKEFHINYSPDDGRGGKDLLGPKDLQVEIGTSLYKFSTETQQYLFPVSLKDYQTAWLGLPPESNLYAAYKYDKSAIFVNDPHYNATAQFRIYKGLEVLFRDNPTLIQKSAFLAEGYPASQLISVQALIDQNPHPSDELIKKVLDSFLINGFMAYE